MLPNLSDSRRIEWTHKKYPASPGEPHLTGRARSGPDDL